jgi:methylglutamate dehydrogenase subunit C
MIRGPSRVSHGLLTQADHLVQFFFDRQAVRGVMGDTVASALLANGRILLGRSFKYHRPRGPYTCGPYEPCALIDVLATTGREPSRLATTLNIYSGLSVESQNRWPSLRFDAFGLNDWFARFLPAGFYYKTFMAPSWAWERLYEPLIRRAAGLGRIDQHASKSPIRAETVHEHVDVLVVGAGSAGLSAAYHLARSGLSVMLAEQDVVLGGGTILDTRWVEWRKSILDRLSTLPNVRCLTRTAVLGAYGRGVFAALEEIPGHSDRNYRDLRERLHVIRARRVVLATGAIERLIAFPGNDIPGVMLAGAGLAYLRRYGVAVGRRPTIFVNSDEAYETAFALHEAGVRAVQIVDVRLSSHAAERARAAGMTVHFGSVIVQAFGRGAVSAVRIESPGSPGHMDIDTDSVLISGGYSPAHALASQLGSTMSWHDGVAAFVPELPAEAGQLAGAVRGLVGLASATRDGESAATAVLASLDRPPTPVSTLCHPADAPRSPLQELWEIPGAGKAFVDLQNDVTAEDVRLAQREGYEHVEHMKRYTTHSMASDQGRIGGLVGSAVLAAARGLHVAQVGLTKPRPPEMPVPLGALAGPEVHKHLQPIRRLPLDAWHRAAGATFVATGQWLRPLVYSCESGWEPVVREARAVRTRVGLSDVSSLGKIDVQGPDAARFLDFIYANTLSTLAVGRARYGIMLREDGMLLDDGTAARLGDRHFVLTTTTANSASVLEHMEFHLQAVRQDFDIVLTDVSDHWAQFALTGPRAREVLTSVASDIDLSDAAFPFLAVASATFAGIRGRVFRISFSGELAYEIAIPARFALQVWTALMEAGRVFDIAPYGLDALNLLRIEKGHVAGPELNGNTTADDLGYGRMLKKVEDYVGRTLARRPGLSAPDRWQLVGIRATDPARPIRNGMQLVDPGDSTILGFVTSSAPSIVLDRWVGLALLSNGRDRLGQCVSGVSPIQREVIRLEIVDSRMVDPENVRVRS